MLSLLLWPKVITLNCVYCNKLLIQICKIKLNRSKKVIGRVFLQRKCCRCCCCCCWCCRCRHDAKSHLSRSTTTAATTTTTSFESLWQQSCYKSSKNVYTISNTIAMQMSNNNNNNNNSFNSIWINLTVTLL